MAGSLSDYLKAKIEDYVLSKAAFTPAATLYVALYTTAPTSAGGGTEVSGTSYARVSVTNNATNWPAATGTTTASKANGAAITFPTAGGSWGTVAAFAVMDADTAGNQYFWGELSSPQSVPSGVTLSFPIGNLTTTLV